MRYPIKIRIFSLIFALLTLTSSLRAQTGDWQAVQQLNPGIPVSVKVKRSYYCIFHYANEDELVCGVNRPLLQLTPRSFLRVQIREVRVWPDPRKSKGGKIGAGIGAGTVAVAALIAGRNNPSSEYPDALTIPVAMAGGAFAGWLVGGLVSAVHAAFQRGKVIYRH